MLRGSLNVAALRDAFDLVVERHEALRTAFISVGGVPRQQVVPPQPFDIPVRDLSAEIDPDGAARAEVLAESRALFHLEKPPLLRARLLRVGVDHHLLLVSLHHIISDGSTLNVLMRELNCCYSAFADGQLPCLPPLAIQHKDFAVWQQTQMTEATMQEHRAYWLDKLAGDIPTLSLERERHRPPVRRFTGGEVVVRLDPAVRKAVQRFQQEKGVTLFAVLVAVLKVVLHQASKEEDIVVGTPVARREHADLEGQIGYYLNNVVLRDSVRGNESFLDLLERVRNTIAEALTHQEYPFERLIEDLNVKPLPGHSPLFDVQVNLMPAETPLLRLGDLAIEGSVMSSGTTLFDLNFMFSNTHAGLALEISYCESLFDAAAVEGLGQSVFRLLAKVCEQSEWSIRSLCGLIDERADDVAAERTEFVAGALSLDEDF